MAAAALRDLEIGEWIDSDDDMARLMLVTAYAGTTMVKVFGYDEVDPPIKYKGGDGRTGTVKGEVIAFDDIDLNSPPVTMTSTMTPKIRP